MDVRQDALTAAAEYVLEVRDRAAEIDGAVATVGQIEVSPGAANVIPGSVRVTVDARAPDQERVDRLVAALGPRGGALPIPPVAMSEQVRQILREEVERAGAPVVELPSGAGHDAAPLGAAGVEAGMLFVRSLNGGASHHRRSSRARRTSTWRWRCSPPPCAASRTASNRLLQGQRRRIVTFAGCRAGPHLEPCRRSLLESRRA